MERLTCEAQQFCKMTLERLVVGIITLAALCGAPMVPVEEDDIMLTASDADTGNWRVNTGGVEVNIEHEHNSDPNSNATWTLKMAHTFYDKEDGTEEKKNESSQNIERTYTPTPFLDYYNLQEGQNGYVDGDASNNIPVDEAPLKDSYSPDYLNFIPQQVYPLAALPPPPPPPSQPNLFIPPITSNTPYGGYHSDEAVLDPDNFEYFEGVGWFKLDSRAMSWVDARDACSASGAHLAVPDTQDRVRVFLKLFQRHPEIPRTAILRAQVYVGVSDPLRNRVFTTVQGNTFNPEFPIWFTNEPDNAPPGEDCVTFHIEGKIRDVPCFYFLPFFCEKDLPVLI